MSADDAEEWLYHLPAFLDRVRERGEHDIRSELDLDIGGVMYHHRGARLPATDATFTWDGDRDRVVLDLDGVGERAARVAFDTGRSWDVFLFRAGGDEPCLCWMSDAEFRVDEADRFDEKAHAVGAGRFSFGLYLHAPATWAEVEARAREVDAPVLVCRPDGRTVVPEATDLAGLADVLPEEFRPTAETPPDHLGVVDAHLTG